MPKSDIAVRAKKYVDDTFSGDGGPPRPFDPGPGNHVGKVPEKLVTSIQKARSDLVSLKQHAARVSDMDPDDIINGKGILANSHVFSIHGGTVRFPDTGAHEHCCDAKKIKSHHHKVAVKPSESKIDLLDSSYKALKELADEAISLLKMLEKAVNDGSAAKKNGNTKRSDRQRKSALAAVKKLQSLEKKHGKIIKDAEKQAAELDKTLLATRARKKTEGKLKLA